MHGLPYTQNGTTGLNSVLIDPVSANMFLWWKATEAYTAADGTGTKITTDGTSIYSLKDLTTNSRHINQSTGAYQPLYKSSDNTFPYVKFNRTNSNFLGPISYTLDQPFTYYMVVRQVLWVNTYYLCDGYTQDTVVIDQQGTSPNLEFYAGSSQVVAGPAVGTWGLIAVCWNGANSLIKINNNTTYSCSLGTNASGGLNLSRRANAAYYPTWDLAEMLIYNTSHTFDTGFGIQTREYLRVKYGLF